MGRRERVTRDQVLDAARELFTGRGFEGTTLAAIAGKLALSPAALLRHAPTKQALFEAAMRRGQGEIRLPLEFLAGVDAAESDPRAVLREAGERFVPFIEEKLGETVVLWLRSNVLAASPTSATLDDLPLLFDRDRHPTPPERALALVEGYLRRARRAGRIELSDPRAGALAFLASLHSYVALHRLARAIDPPIPLARYLDGLIEIWSAGAIREPAPAAPARGRRGESKKRSRLSGRSS
jgi:AcrR family transcriptional regulator